MAAHETTAADTAPRPDRLEPAVIRIALILMLGSFASALDMTIVNVSIGTLGRHFHASVSTLQWVSTGYLLALSMVVPLTGWAADRYGAKRMWLLSLAVFLGGSALCGAAWSLGSLIAFRVLQGAGGGMLLPLVRLILAEAAGRERLARAMTFVVVPGILAPVLGPVLGGVLVDEAGWRWIFYVNVPVCAIGMLLSWRALPADHRRGTTPLDARGLALLSLGLAAIVYGLAEAGNRRDFTAAAVVLPLLIGAALLLAYTLHALRTPRAPIIDPRLFRVRSFAASSVLLLLTGTSMFGAMFLLPLYYQQVHGDSVIQAGLALAPQGAGTGLAMLFAGRLIDRTGAVRAAILIGIVLTGAATVPYALAGPHSDQWLISAALVVRGIGQGTVLLAAMTATYYGLTREQIAPATSASRLSQQVGGGLGIAVLAVILQHQTTAHSAATAFNHTFWWSLALSTLALVPALLLPARRA